MLQDWRKVDILTAAQHSVSTITSAVNDHQTAVQIQLAKNCKLITSL